MTLPQVRLSLPAGDEVSVALHGAHVLSWKTAEGRERLYLSPQALLDGKSPIRGGVPVCFPQFNQRVLGGRALPKHGFARVLPWAVRGQSGTAQLAQLRLALQDDAVTRAQWPHAFEALLDITLTPQALRIEFSVTNTDAVAWPFALALHSYLRVDDITQASLDGLGGQPYWDAVTHLHEPGHRQVQGPQALRFAAETDRVYAASPAPLTLSQQALPADDRALEPMMRISQSRGFSETVVWNPGAVLSASLADMPDDGFRHMLCVEAATIDTPVQLPPGQTWTASQTLMAL